MPPLLRAGVLVTYDDLVTAVPKTPVVYGDATGAVAGTYELEAPVG